MRVLVWVLAAALSTPAWAADDRADWRSFLGGRGNVAAEAELPRSWSVETGENIAWTAELPGRGVSSPIVIDGRVVVTCSSGEPENQLHVLAFDQQTGALLWQRDFEATGRTKFNEATALAANTPASDGGRIFAMFSSNDLAALNLDGNVLWTRSLTAEHPQAGNDFGMASSPLAAGELVIVQCDGEHEAFAAAFDARDGAPRWERPRKAGGSWSSPLALQQTVDGEQVAAVAFQSAEGIETLRVDTGELIWKAELPCETIPSPIAADDRLIVSAQGLVALEADAAAGDAEVVWRAKGLRPAAASPLMHGGRVYAVNRGGLLTCAEFGGDETAWRLRLGGTFWATPLLASGRLYCINGAGKAFVVELGDTAEVSAEINFGEDVLASPAVADNAMFVRSHRHLWKIAE